MCPWVQMSQIFVYPPPIVMIQPYSVWEVNLEQLNLPLVFRVRIDPHGHPRRSPEQAKDVPIHLILRKNRRTWTLHCTLAALLGHRRYNFDQEKWRIWRMNMNWWDRRKRLKKKIFPCLQKPIHGQFKDMNKKKITHLRRRRKLKDLLNCIKELWPSQEK